MTKPKAKPNPPPPNGKKKVTAKIVVNPAAKNTEPKKEWDNTSEFPLSDIGIGDEVESSYHGKGVMNRFISGNHPLEIDFGGRSLSYSKDGKYFDDDSAFADKNPVLKITKKMPPMTATEE